MTAGLIASLSGNGGVMLLGPGNSQAHLVLCGAHVFDVHALKADANVCTTVVGTAVTPTSTSSSLTVTSGVKPSFGMGFNVVVPASSNQTKLYGNGMTAGQIALQAGLGGAMLFGPGNSQAHMVLCGNHVIDVHAVKAQGGACASTLGVTTGVSPTTSEVAAGVSPTTSAGTTGTSVGTAASGQASLPSSSAAVTTFTKAKGHARATGVLGATTSGAVLGATARQSTLPFTGLALGLPLGVALMLLVSGIGIRRAARSRR